jgi:hypothetical protein
LVEAFIASKNNHNIDLYLIIITIIRMDTVDALTSTVHSQHALLALLDTRQLDTGSNQTLVIGSNYVIIISVQESRRRKEMQKKILF